MFINSRKLVITKLLLTVMLKQCP